MTLKKVQTCSSVNNIATKFCPSCPQAAPKLPPNWRPQTASPKLPAPNCQPQTASKLPPICNLLSAVTLKNQK